VTFGTLLKFQLYLLQDHHKENLKTQVAEKSIMEHKISSTEYLLDAPVRFEMVELVFMLRFDACTRILWNCMTIDVIS
jgi:hypothetical protein